MKTTNQRVCELCIVIISVFPYLHMYTYAMCELCFGVLQRGRSVYCRVFVCCIFDEIITPVIYRDIFICFMHYFSGIFHFGLVSYRVSTVAIVATYNLKVIRMLFAFTLCECALETAWRAVKSVCDRYY